MYHAQAVVGESTVATFVFRTGLLIRAKHPYRDRDYRDKGVHDTHMSCLGGEYRFPRDYPGGEGAAAPVFTQICSSLRKVGCLFGIG